VFIRSLRWLSGYVCIWPPVDETLASSYTLDVIRDLDYIAETHTITKRPWTRLLVKDEQVNADTVVKREGSENFRHHFFGDKVSTQCIRSCLKARSGYRWIVQELVPQQRIFGELRTFVLGGKVLHTMATTMTGDGNQVEKADMAYTLSELKSVIPTLCHRLTDLLCLG
jgi:hypothetical protein